MNTSPLTFAKAAWEQEHHEVPKIEAVKLENAEVVYGSGKKTIQALAPTSMTIEQGEFVALVGPSGCGKSTILKLVSGLLPATHGHVHVGGREVGAKRIGVGMAFQNPTLLPWLSVRKNVMLPLKIVPPFRDRYQKERNGEFRDRAESLLEKVGLAGFGDKQPWELSGGMLQRASLCRALIHDPAMLLLDEPFGALDQFTREELWDTLQSLWQETKPTVLLVTHDLREAAYLGTRICVMSPRPGRILDDREVQLPRPRTIDMTFSQEFVSLTQQMRQLITHTRLDLPKEKS
ncbi:ABC transporter ATP-binding protein [Marinobacter sp. M3C]|jgi:NitT/TauT family transport system ATP-binding protein|uniref:ABC transporter ATP-binding protein n=1 Tax=unclassified Marinobacter TaxID=83889 RepID=UPI00200FC704|nr:MULTISPECIES: ABC transporter ATP-binding protein [unclassified Marinobacter]MCL1477432.1 ABC transporter ATP-binding protein [Marinobacter sp.]UQG57381.1 ABC transporter ATP-binding protein [Marinobacter sp. M4C]UQG61446.1 ABC transporter ATP-binding protein [Marinobacter sp. M3C]UQG66185.1 ABC transporter ATP-binding protein [Marinobacter sp. M2C]UQG70465.1 ABC transporter ATP-binding protein [Marinobacter sp. M1C]